MKILFFILMALIFHGETIKQHPKCRGPASNYACEYFYDLLEDDIPQAIIDFLKKYSVSAPPAQMQAIELFKLYGHFVVNIPGVDFNENFVANIFVYEDENHKEFVGYRDTEHEASKNKKEGLYAHNKFSVEELTSKAGADFVKYESYYNLMRFNVKAINYDAEQGGDFVLTYDLLQPKIFATSTMQIGTMKFKVKKINDKLYSYYIDPEGNEIRFNGIYLQSPNSKPLQGIENLVLFDNGKHVATIAAADKVPANRSIKIF